MRWVADHRVRKVGGLWSVDTCKHALCGLVCFSCNETIVFGIIGNETLVSGQSRPRFPPSISSLAHLITFGRDHRYIDILAMRGKLHTAQKSLIDACSRYPALRVPEYIEMSKVSRSDLFLWGLNGWCSMLTAMGSDRRSPRNKDGGKSMRRMCDRRRVFCGSEKWNWNGHSLV